MNRSDGLYCFHFDYDPVCNENVQAISSLKWNSPVFQRLSGPDARKERLATLIPGTDILDTPTLTGPGPKPYVLLSQHR
jgi:hypothetical protein